jgi:hypothetical protein
LPITSMFGPLGTTRSAGLARSSLFALCRIRNFVAIATAKSKHSMTLSTLQKQSCLWTTDVSRRFRSNPLPGRIFEIAIYRHLIKSPESTSKLNCVVVPTQERVGPPLPSSSTSWSGLISIPMCLSSSHPLELTSLAHS